MDTRLWSWTVQSELEDSSSWSWNLLNVTFQTLYSWVPWFAVNRRQTIFQERIHNTLPMRVLANFLQRLSNISHIPNTYHAIISGGSQVIWLVWIIIHILDWKLMCLIYRQCSKWCHVSACVWRIPNKSRLFVGRAFTKSRHARRCRWTSQIIGAHARFSSNGNRVWMMGIPCSWADFDFLLCGRYCLSQLVDSCHIVGVGFQLFRLPNDYCNVTTMSICHDILERI